MIHIETITTWLPTEVGGRKKPIRFEMGSYRPHLVVSGTTELLGVVLEAGPEIISPGETLYIWFRSTYSDIDYSQLQPGAQFAVVEGPQVVGVGKVLHRREKSTE